jgi:hypothetical protein
LAFSYKINTDRQVIGFNNGYNFLITAIQSIFPRVMVLSPKYAHSKQLFT